jgi:hypothetical protein
VCSGFFGAGFLARSFILDPFMTVVCECVSSPRLRALKPSCGEGDVRGIRLLNRSPTFNSCRHPAPTNAVEQTSGAPAEQHLVGPLRLDFQERCLTPI